MGYQKLINTNIRKLRQNNNLTQEDFAEKIGISVQGLSNIERNRYQPNAETIDKICKAFAIKPVELLLNPNDENAEILSNINMLLSQCTTKKLKKIYDIIIMLVKM